MSRPAGMPRPPGAAYDHDVGAWLRYYQRAERWNLACAADLDDYPTSKAYALTNAARFGRGVTEVLIGAHRLQMNGQWS